MRNTQVGAVAILMCLAAGTVAGKSDEQTNATIITSERFFFEAETREAVFEENVVVTDSRMVFQTTKLWLSFDEDQRVRTIRAEGAVDFSGTSRPDQAGSDGSDGSAETNLTRIRAKKFLYKADSQWAQFQEDVHVQDARLDLRAKISRVHFADDETVRAIEAQGDAVQVRQEIPGQPLRRAGCRRLKYDAKTGKIVLLDNAWVTQGNNVLRGERITIWKNEQRIQSEEKVRFKFYVDRENEGLSAFPGNI